jgi:hypothetical protein
MLGRTSQGPLAVVAQFGQVGADGGKARRSADRGSCRPLPPFARLAEEGLEFTAWPMGCLVELQTVRRGCTLADTRPGNSRTVSTLSGVTGAGSGGLLQTPTFSWSFPPGVLPSGLSVFYQGLVIEFPPGGPVISFTETSLMTIP